MHTFLLQYFFIQELHFQRQLFALSHMIGSKFVNCPPPRLKATLFRVAFLFVFMHWYEFEDTIFEKWYFMAISTALN